MVFESRTDLQNSKEEEQNNDNDCCHCDSTFLRRISCYMGIGPPRLIHPHIRVEIRLPPGRMVIGY